MIADIRYVERERNVWNYDGPSYMQKYKVLQVRYSNVVIDDICRDLGPWTDIRTESEDVI